MPSKIGAICAFIFLMFSLWLGRNGDGQIFVAFISWPLSILVSAVCYFCDEFCSRKDVPFVMTVLFGLIQYYFFGWLVAKLFLISRTRVEN